MLGEGGFHFLRCSACFVLIVTGKMNELFAVLGSLKICQVCIVYFCQNLFLVIFCVPEGLDTLNGLWFCFAI